jgi:hypothetical protein
MICCKLRRKLHKWNNNKQCTGNYPSDFSVLHPSKEADFLMQQKSHCKGVNSITSGPQKRVQSPKVSSLLLACLGCTDRVLSCEAFDSAKFGGPSWMSEVRWSFVNVRGTFIEYTYETGTSSVGSVWFPDALDSVIESRSGKCCCFFTISFIYNISFSLSGGPDFRILFSRGFKNTASVWACEFYNEITKNYFFMIF